MGATPTRAAGDHNRPPVAETRFPAFVPCHPKDLVTLPFCVEALRRHPQITTVSVIGQRSLQPHCEHLGIGFVDELSLLDPWFPASEPMSDRHWYYQMFLKLSVAFGEDDPPDRYLIADADTVLLHPFPLIDEVSGTALHPKMSEHVTRYYSGMRELLGHDVPYEGSHIAHFMVFRTPVVHAMFAEFARVAGRPAEDGRAVLREFLQRCDSKTLAFSEYETYGYYTQLHFPDELAWATRRQLNMLYVTPNEHVLTRLAPYYHYCSFHAYRRPNRLALSVAGSTWLQLRLARDRLSGRQIQAAAHPQATKVASRPAP
jgi:hypothetical protein